MARRGMKIERVIAILGVVVIALGLLVVWLVSRNAFQPQQVSALDRAQTQLRAHLSERAPIVYSEEGRRNSICGYVRTGGQNVAFVSRPNRIILETDPLKTEFEGMQADLCPGFMRPPNPPVVK